MAEKTINIVLEEQDLSLGQRLLKASVFGLALCVLSSILVFFAINTPKGALFIEYYFGSIDGFRVRLHISTYMVAWHAASMALIALVLAYTLLLWVWVVVGMGPEKRIRSDQIRVSEVHKTNGFIGNKMLNGIAFGFVTLIVLSSNIGTETFNFESKARIIFFGISQFFWAFVACFVFWVCPFVYFYNSRWIEKSEHAS